MRAAGDSGDGGWWWPRGRGWAGAGKRARCVRLGWLLAEARASDSARGRGQLQELLACGVRRACPAREDLPRDAWRRPPLHSPRAARLPPAKWRPAARRQPRRPATTRQPQIMALARPVPRCALHWPHAAPSHAATPGGHVMCCGSDWCTRGVRHVMR